MKLTTRGQRFGAALVLLVGVGLLFVDPFILAAAAVGAAFLTYELADAISSSRGRGTFEFAPAVLEERMPRGTRKRVKTALRATRALSLDLSSTKWLNSVGSSFPSGESQVELEARSDLAGNFEVNGVPADVRSRYGLFSTRISVPLRIDLKVYPRFLATAVAALEFLMRTGPGIEGEVEKNMIGVGLEYAETREYLPEDNLRRIDWRATARSSTLMIKHFYREGGGALHVICSMEAPGPKTHDEMATQLIDLVLSSAARGNPITVTTYEQDRRLTHYSGTGRSVLASTLNLVFTSTGTTYDDVYSILDIVPISTERRALLMAGKKRLAELIQRGGRSRGLVTDFKALVAELSSLDVMPTFIVLSSLVSGRERMAETIDELKGRRAGVTLVYPLKPWTDARTLEEGYIMTQSQEKMLKFAESSGCEIGPIPFRFVARVGHPALQAGAPV